MKKLSILLIITAVIIFTAGACSSPNTSNTSTTSPPSTTSTTSSGATFQTLAASGQTVYTNSCATCHGSSGQGVSGPALWGSGFVVGQYNGTTLFAANAQAMLTFVSTSMPLTSPGSLSQQQYIDVLCYLLIQENEVAGSTTFNQSGLSGITLK